MREPRSSRNPTKLRRRGPHPRPSPRVRVVSERPIYGCFTDKGDTSVGIHANQRFWAAVLAATLGVLGAPLAVVAGTGGSGESHGNPVELAAVPLGLSPVPIPASGEHG